MTDLKLGKKPATHDKRDLLFSDYREPGALPPHPNSYGFGNLIPKNSWSMLGNDKAGDCVWASAAHQTMLWNAAVKAPVTLFTEESVLSDYSAVTGYDPISGANDDGTNIRDALKYRQKTGILDGAGQRHKIGAYVALEPGNHEQILEALFLFGIVELGIEFPDYAMDQFDSGKAWTVRPGGSIEGGHDIPIVRRPNRSNNSIVTWAKMIEMSDGFFKKFCDESWTIISPEFLANNVTPGGFNMQQLQADLAAL